MKKRRLAAWLLTLAMAVSGLAACGDSGSGGANTSGDAEKTAGTEADASAGDQTGTTPEGTKAGGAADPSDPYAGIDTSEPVEITMYVIGGEATDKDLVVEQINERLQEKINATLDLQVIPLSEFATRYPLVLSGGEKVDLIYVGGMVNFTENASKNAFMELTDEFLNTYMPQTMATMPEQAWKQSQIGGTLYRVPRNQSTYSSYYPLVAIRGDLREKYNLPELTSFEDYENYLFTIAENETGIYGFYNMPTFIPAIFAFVEVKNNLLQIIKGDYFVWKDDGTFSTDEVEYYYLTDEYREYALQMAEWAKKGVWPSDAIAGTVSPVDYFAQGRSASVNISLDQVDSTIANAASNGITDVEVYDIFPDTTSRLSDYAGDAIAIPYSSENPERAAMVLDLLKNDRELNLLFVGGIEGEHYIYDEASNTRSDGPSAANYAWDGFGWAIRNSWNPTLEKSELTLSLTGPIEERTLGDYWPCDGFAFDNTPVKTQKSVVESLVSEYSTSFDLGVFGDDTEAKLDEFIGKLQEAGIEDIKAEYLRQLSEYVGE